jgi:hypothetical protein
MYVFMCVCSCVCVYEMRRFLSVCAYACLFVCVHLFVYVPFRSACFKGHTHTAQTHPHTHTHTHTRTPATLRVHTSKPIHTPQTQRRHAHTHNNTNTAHTRTHAPPTSRILFQCISQSLDHLRTRPHTKVGAILLLLGTIRHIHRTINRIFHIKLLQIQFGRFLQGVHCGSKASQRGRVVWYDGQCFGVLFACSAVVVFFLFKPSECTERSCNKFWRLRPRVYV